MNTAICCDLTKQSRKTTPLDGLPLSVEKLTVSSIIIIIIIIKENSIKLFYDCSYIILVILL